MAAETILHSGSFYDYEGNEIKVTFYKKIDLNVSPTSLTFPAGGGSMSVSIWSRTGSAVLSDAPSWLNYVQTRVDPIPGTNWYKYTYSIECDPNSQTSERTYIWNVYIEDGEGAGEVSTSFTVTQEAASEYDIHAEPGALNYTSTGGTQYVTIWSETGSAALSDPVEWLNYVQYSREQIPGTNWYKYTYAIGCDPNTTGSPRSYTWDVYIEDGEGAGIAHTSFIVNQSN